jgi:hypothetical protein
LLNLTEGGSTLPIYSSKGLPLSPVFPLLATRWPSIYKSIAAQDAKPIHNFL